MLITTLCYIIQNDQVLLLHRNKYPQDPNYLKYIGVGGKVKIGETVDACMKREVKEETNLDVITYSYRGKVLFQSNKYPTETLHLYLVHEVKGEMASCDEGDLVWVTIQDMFSYPMWEGDRHFLKPLFESNDIIDLTLTYYNDEVVDYQKR